MFEKGDLVVLRSGSPEMVFVEEAIGKMLCVWYSDNLNSFQEHYFVKEALKKVELI